MKPVQLGHMRVRKFEEESGVTIPIPIATFPGLTSERFKALQQELDPRAFDAATETLPFSMHTYVLETRNRVILVDTCNGNDKLRTGVMAGSSMLKNKYIENLAALGLKPEDVDMVMCTHLHSDHVGWNTKLENGRWVPTFPKARYLMSRTDVEAYKALPPDHPQAQLVTEAFNDSVLPVIAAGRADLIEHNHTVERELDDNVWIEGAPGHTPGSYMLHAHCGHEHGLFCGDVFHHPIQIQDTSLHLGVDDNLEKAHAQRRRVVETYTDTATHLFAAHFPAPTAGRIVSSKGGTRFRYHE